MPVALTVEGQGRLPADAQVALYRIAQEALNNVAKHSGASRVSVSLRFQHGHVKLLIGDDGRGYDQSNVPADRLGLGIMRERAEAIGARLEIDSQPGQGTWVRVALACEGSRSEQPSLS